MAAWLIRWARQRWAEIGILGLIFAGLVVIEVIIQSIPWLEEHAPWISYNLGHGVHLRHVAEALLAFAAAAIVLIFRFGKRKPPPGPLGLLHFLEVPGTPDPAHFKFRIPQAETDLAPFVEFSDDEADIANRHPVLFGASRWQLYTNWFRINRQAFVLLDRHNAKSNAWETISLSIVLPLTNDGYDRLCNGDLKIIEMRDPEIAPEGTASSKFLIDTWIVKKKGQARQVNKPIREPLKKYARALLFVHVGIFWDSTAAAAFLVEADNPHIREICEEIGFDGSRRTKDGEILQQLSYPGNRGNEELMRRLTVIANNVRVIRSWPVVGFRP